MDQIKKPCDNCTVNIEQSILYDEVICYKTCKDFQKWKSGKIEKLANKLGSAKTPEEKRNILNEAYRSDN